MPLMPNLLERTLFLTLNQGPGVMLDLWSGPAFRIVLAALRLDLFERLASQPLTAASLAQSLGTDPQGTQLLLSALAPLGYVKFSNGAYVLTEMSRKWLTGSGTVNLAPFFRYWGAVIEEFFPRLEESLRSGRPAVNLYTWLEQHPEVARDFQEGMVALTDYAKDDVVARISLPPATKRLLDVGGGHAAYTIALCQRYPALEAVVFDSLQALVVGRAQIEAAGLAARVMMQSGDFLHEDLGTGFDVVLLFNIIHGLTPTQNLDLLRKAKAALNPGGQVILLEQIPGSAPLPLAEAAVNILGLSYYHLLGGRAYSIEDIQEWQAQVGFQHMSRTNIAKAGSALITLA